MTIEQLTVDHDTRAYASTQGDDDEVLHTACHTINHLTNGSGIGIIGQGYGDIVQTLAEQLGEGHHTIMSPRQIGGKLDGAVIIVAVRGTYTHGLDLLDTAHLVDDDL